LRKRGYCRKFSHYDTRGKIVLITIPEEKFFSLQYQRKKAEKQRKRKDGEKKEKKKRKDGVSCDSKVHN
jgi:hypothetical protein